MARNDSGAAKKPRRNPFTQIRSVYRTVKQLDPKIGWWMLGGALVVLLVGLLVGLLMGHPVASLAVAVPFALLAAMIVLSRRGERAAFSQMEGQRGAALGGLSAIRRGWYIEQEPVAADAQRQGDLQHAAVVFRALGRPGVVLLGEGPGARVKKLLDKETKKVARVAPGVPVHTYVVGPGDDELPARKVRSTLVRLRPQLSKEEMAVVNKRLKSLPGIRQNVPAGVDPTRVRMDRRSLRGR